MNILIEIGHPAHVHFFRGVIHRLQSGGHKLILVTRNKEITDRLLDEMGFTYISLSRPSPGKMGMMAELIKRWVAIWKIIGREKIDVVASISGISTAVPAKLRRVPNITITDTEDATITNYIAFPFSDSILTPHFFLKNLGPKQNRYRGLHETAYLRSFEHSGLDQRISALGLKRPYSVIRLIAYDAVHDWRLRASTEDDIWKAIHNLEKFGKVYITSQKELMGDFQKYRLQVPITEIHDVMAAAQIFIGESPTMAVEAALLGTPSFLISQRSPNLGNMIGLEKIGLLRNLPGWPEVGPTLQEIQDINLLKKEWMTQAQSFIRSTVDTQEYVIACMMSLKQKARRNNGLHA